MTGDWRLGTEDSSVERLLEALAARGWTLAVAEADTGGLLLEWLTAVPGSSRVLLGGVVAYHDSLKAGLLGVADAELRQHGAVSAAVARGMAEGVRRLTGADVGVATTGVAGPGGGTERKPVGLAWLAVAHAGGTVVREQRSNGDRAANRASAAEGLVRLALEEVLRAED